MEPMFQFAHKITEMHLPFSGFINLSRCQKNWDTTCAIEHVVTSKLSLSSRRALWVVKLFITTVVISVLVVAEILPDVDTCLIKLC